MEKIPALIDAGLYWWQWVVVTIIGLAFERTACLMITTALQVEGSA